MLKPQQRHELEKSFDTNGKPTGKEIEEISKQLELTKETVYRWFCRRRSEEREKIGSVNARFVTKDPQQRQVLEKSFSANRKPTGEVMEEISKQLDIPKKAVYNWFYQRRSKEQKVQQTVAKTNG